jgi:hypothetical protein
MADDAALSPAPVGDTKQWFAAWIARLVPNITALIQRFPWSMAAFVFLVSMLSLNDVGIIVLSHTSPPFQIRGLADNAVLGLLAALIGLTGIALAAEGLDWPATRLHGLSSAWAAFCAGLVAAAAGRWPWFMPNLHILVASAALALCASTSFGRPSQQAAGAIFGGAARLALGGFAAWFIVALVSGLLGDGFQPFPQMPPPSRILVMSLAPLLILQWLPRPRPAEQPDQPPGPITMAVIDGLVVPIGVLILAIATCVMVGEAMRTQVTQLSEGAWPATAVVLAIATLIYLLAAPLHDSQSPITRMLRRIYPFLAIVPIAVLVLFFLTQWREFSSPARNAPHIYLDGWYWLVTAPLAVIVIALLAIVKPAWRDLRLAVLATSTFLCAAAVGPWGERAYEARRAGAHVEILLTQAGILKDRKVIAGPAPNTNPHLHSQASVALNRLERIDGLASIAPWFRGLPGDPFVALSWDRANQPGVNSNDVLQRLGLVQLQGQPQLRPNTTTVQISSNYNGSAILPIAGYPRIAGPVRIGGPMAPPIAPLTPARPISQRIGETLSIEQTGTAVKIVEFRPDPPGPQTANINLQPLLLKLVEVTRARALELENQRKALEASMASTPGSPPVVPQPTIPVPPPFHPVQIIEAESGSLKAALLITQLSAQLGPATENQLFSVQGQAWLLLGPVAPVTGTKF